MSSTSTRNQDFLLQKAETISQAMPVFAPLETKDITQYDILLWRSTGEETSPYRAALIVWMDQGERTSDKDDAFHQESARPFKLLLRTNYQMGWRAAMQCLHELIDTRLQRLLDGMDEGDVHEQR